MTDELHRLRLKRRNQIMGILFWLGPTCFLGLPLALALCGIRNDRVLYAVWIAYAAASVLYMIFGYTCPRCGRNLIGTRWLAEQGHPQRSCPRCGLDLG